MNIPITDRFRKTSELLAAAVAVTGLIVLAGWFFCVPLLRSVLPGMVEMKSNTAACFVLLGAAVWLLQERRLGDRRAFVAGLLSASVCFTVAGLTLYEYVSGVDIGLDQLLFRESPGALLTSSPGRMAFNTCIAFMLTAASAAGLAARGAALRLSAQVAAVAAGLLGFISLIGYFYGISPLYFGLHFSTAMALHTTALFVLASLAVLFARPGEGLMLEVSGDGYGSLAFRRLFVFAVVLPVTLGWLKVLLERRGLLGPEMGLSLVAIGNMVGAGAMIYLLSGYLNRLDAVRRRAEADLRNAQRLESLGLLAGGIAHDFNNLLVGILGNLSLIKHKADKDLEVQELAREAVSAADRAKALALRLLTFSKGGAPVMKPHDAGRLLRENARFAARGSSCLCRFKLRQGLPAVMADENQFGQVIGNLVQNAAQAMAGGGVLEIEAAAERLPEGSAVPLPAGEYVRMTLSDNGPGIPPELLPRVFEPYFSTRPGGHGLGLSIAHSIVGRHGGHISAGAAPGGGARFTIYLPAAPGAVLTEKPDAAPARAYKGKVLVMDDEEIVLRSMDRMLRELGCECVPARDGARAIELWREAAEAGRPFDLAVMDLTVPGGMGGKEAAQGIRAISPGAKVLVSSGYSEDPVLQDPSGHGFDAALGKPYKFEELAAALAALRVGGQPEPGVPGRG